jgi:putative membrane protein
MARQTRPRARLSEALQRDPRIYFAAERTYLAWIRTGLGLMGFGFVVARFGLFLKELALTRPDLGTKSSGFSLWVGTSLILVGVAVNVISTVTYYQEIVQLNRGETAADQHSMTAIVVATLLALCGVGMAVYLVLVR